MKLLKIIESAVILAGGEGLRLRPLTDEIPKAMIMIAGKPLLQWIVEWLKEAGIVRIVIGVAYKQEKIMNYFGDGSKFKIETKYSTHTVEGGTCQGFKFAIERYINDDVFLAMNGDELVDLDLMKFTNFHNEKGGMATVAVAPLRSPFGVVKLDGSDIVGFDEKPILKSHNVSIGTYVFSRKVLEYMPEMGDVERTLFPKLSSMRKLKAYVHNGFWSTINTAKDLEEAENILKRRK